MGSQDHLLNDSPLFCNKDFQDIPEFTEGAPAWPSGMCYGYNERCLVVVVHVSLGRINGEPCEFCATFYRTPKEFDCGRDKDSSIILRPEAKLLSRNIGDNHIEQPVLVSIIEIGEKPEQRRELTVRSIVRLRSLDSCLRSTAQGCNTPLDVRIGERLGVLDDVEPVEQDLGLGRVLFHQIGVGRPHEWVRPGGSGHTSGTAGHDGFPIVRGMRPRWRELRAAQKMATSVRIGRPSKAPQLTPAPLARTSPSSTARPGEKCWPASMRIPSTNIERPATIPGRRSRNPITGRNDSARLAQKCITLSLTCKRPMSTITGEAAGSREPMTTQHISAAHRSSIRVRACRELPMEPHDAFVYRF